MLHEQRVTIWVAIRCGDLVRFPDAQRPHCRPEFVCRRLASWHVSNQRDRADAQTCRRYACQRHRFAVILANDGARLAAEADPPTVARTSARIRQSRTLFRRCNHDAERAVQRSIVTTIPPGTPMCHRRSRAEVSGMDSYLTTARILHCDGVARPVWSEVDHPPGPPAKIRTRDRREPDELGQTRPHPSAA